MVLLWIIELMADIYNEAQIYALPGLEICGFQVSVLDCLMITSRPE